MHAVWLRQTGRVCLLPNIADRVCNIGCTNKLCNMSLFWLFLLLFQLDQHDNHAFGNDEVLAVMSIFDKGQAECRGLKHALAMDHLMHLAGLANGSSVLLHCCEHVCQPEFAPESAKLSWRNKFVDVTETSKHSILHEGVLHTQAVPMQDPPCASFFGGNCVMETFL